jgi:peroxiredoxin
MYDELEKRDTVVVAIAQEDKDLESHGKMAQKLKPSPRMDLVADLDRRDTLEYDRTTMYLIDKKGAVRQIFPMMIHMRPTWFAVLNEIDRLGLAQN